MGSDWGVARPQMPQMESGLFTPVPFHKASTYTRLLLTDIFRRPQVRKTRENFIKTALEQTLMVLDKTVNGTFRDGMMGLEETGKYLSRDTVSLKLSRP
jgi:hypothetical protein